MNRNQQVVIEYLQEEIRVLKEQLGKRPRSNDSTNATSSLRPWSADSIIATLAKRPPEALIARHNVTALRAAHVHLGYNREQPVLRISFRSAPSQVPIRFESFKDQSDLRLSFRYRQTSPEAAAGSANPPTLPLKASWLFTRPA